MGLACVHTPLLLSLSPTALPSGQPRPHPWAVGSPDPTVHIPAVSRPSHFPPTPPTPPKTRRNAPLPSPIHPNPSIPPIFSSHFSPPPLLLLLPAEATRGRERGEGRGRGSPLPPPRLPPIGDRGGGTIPGGSSRRGVRTVLFLYIFFLFYLVSWLWFRVDGLDAWYGWAGGR